MDSQEALDGFDVSIEDLTDFKAKVAPLLAAWASGDVAAIDKLGSDEMRRDAPSAYRALLVNRNANWIDRRRSADSIAFRHKRWR